MNINLLLSFPLFLICTQLLGQTSKVTFSVNMSHMASQDLFDPEVESVDIAGTFNGWGSTPLVLQKGSESTIYSGTIDIPTGEEIGFKARINSEWNGREEFPGGGDNRYHKIAKDTLIEFWYSDQLPDSILQVRIENSSLPVQPDEVLSYYDKSTGSPVAWRWEFEKGTPNQSTEQNPTVTYGQFGNFDVTLTIYNAAGDSAKKEFKNYVRVDSLKTYWWNEVVWYEVFVRSFYDSDGDGIGDIQGLIEKLDYLNDGNPETTDDLGIGGIWLMPIQESPSYHGYDVTNYYKIEPDYGTNEDFKHLMEEAHKRGIKVIIDYVMNHTSTQHPWFIGSRNNTEEYRDYYVWKKNHPGVSGPWGQNAWHKYGNEHYYGVFWDQMPDLNYFNPKVKQKMFDVASWWIDEMDVDGFRLDAVKYITEEGTLYEDTPSTFDFWKEFRKHYKSSNDSIFSVGEAWTSTELAKQYVENDGLDYVFEFDLANAILSTANSGNPDPLNAQLSKVLASYPYMQFGSFQSNHDIDRTMDILQRNESKAKVSAALLLTLPGIPYIYYGEELGQSGSKPDENIRRPFQWSGEPFAGFSPSAAWNEPFPDYSTRNVLDFSKDSTSIYNLYKRLIAARNQLPALQSGKYQPIDSVNNLYAFERIKGSERVLVLHNLSTNAVTNFSLDLTTFLNKEDKVFDYTSGDSMQVSDGMLYIEQIDPQSTLILSAKKPTAGLLQKKITATFNLDISPLIKAGLYDASIDYVDVQLKNLVGETIVKQLEVTEDPTLLSFTIEDFIGKSWKYRYRLNGDVGVTSEFHNSKERRSLIFNSELDSVRDIYKLSGQQVVGIENPYEPITEVYPNPFGHSLQITSENPIIDLQVMNVQGQLLPYKAVTHSTQSMTLKFPKGLRQGFYFIQIQTPSDRRSVKVLKR